MRVCSMTSAPDDEGYIDNGRLLRGLRRPGLLRRRLHATIMAFTGVPESHCFTPSPSMHRV